MRVIEQSSYNIIKLFEQLGSSLWTMLLSRYGLLNRHVKQENKININVSRFTKRLAWRLSSAATCPSCHTTRDDFGSGNYEKLQIDIFWCVIFYINCFLRFAACQNPLQGLIIVIIFVQPGSRLFLRKTNSKLLFDRKWAGLKGTMATFLPDVHRKVSPFCWKLVKRTANAWCHFEVISIEMCVRSLWGHSIVYLLFCN